MLYGNFRLSIVTNLLAFVRMVEVSEVRGLELEAEMRTYNNSKKWIGTTLAQIATTFFSCMSEDIFKV